MKDLKNICLMYNSKDNVLQVSLPCLPLSEEPNPEKDFQEKKAKEIERPLDLWKLKKITDYCLLKIDDNKELLRPEGSYAYGFASKFRGRIKNFEVCHKSEISNTIQTTNTFSYYSVIWIQLHECLTLTRLAHCNVLLIEILMK